MYALKNVIPGFTEMTKQQLFDMSARHILSTGVKSMKFNKEADQEFCAYSGTGCAAAPFLKPECRERFDDDMSWIGLRDAGHVPDHEYEFVGRLQSCHDASGYNGQPFIMEWKSRMLNVANEFHLNIDVFKEDVCPVNACS